MTTNLDRYKADLKRLLRAGRELYTSLQHECYPERLEPLLRQLYKEKTDDYIKSLPSVTNTYQRWYSESLALIRQVLPDRLQDFIRHYERPKTRKELTAETYRIEDYLSGLEATRGFEKTKVVGRDSAIPILLQQIAIVEAAEARFESSLFDIRQMVQADLFDSEIVAAEHLAKNKFYRSAGALAGVVLEGHLAQVCTDHRLALTGKNHTISIYNDALKTAAVIDVPQWRFVLHLADIRNLCDHRRTAEPTNEQIADLLAGARKVVKTVF